MFKYWFTFFVFFCFYIDLSAQGDKGFILKGNIAGIKNNTQLYLKLGDDTLYTTKSVGSEFQFSGKVDGEANYFFLYIDSTVTKKPSNALWLVNGEMKLEGAVSDWNSLVLVGSEAHDEFSRVIDFYRANKNQRVLDSFYIKFISDHPNSLYVSDLILKAAFLLTDKGVMKAYENLTPRAKNSFYGKELKGVVHMMSSSPKESKNSVSIRVPDFHYTSTKGERVKVMDDIGLSKFTLIDFWASWCSPCRAAIPELKKVFEAFKDCGFNIIGVSTDKNKNAWEKALKEEKTPWLNRLDNIDYAGKNIFGFVAIPAYIIVDQKGNVVYADYLTSFRSAIDDKKRRNISKDLYQLVSELVNK